MADQNRFGRPNAEIGQKMANGRLIFPALDMDEFDSIYSLI